MFWPTLKIDNKIAKESSKTLETVTIEDKKIISKSDYFQEIGSPLPINYNVICDSTFVSKLNISESYNFAQTNTYNFKLFEIKRIYLLTNSFFYCP